MEFYASLEEAIKKRQIPGASTSRVDWHEGGAFSAKREYLRVSRENNSFDICGAPFGTGFFVSWWLSSAPLQLEAWQGFVAVIALLVLYSFFTAAFGTFGGIFFLIIGLAVTYAVFNAIATKGSQESNIKILSTPVIGPIYEAIFRPIAYYRIDTALMYQSAIHTAVMEVVDEITKTRGIRALSELERKPILRELFQR